MKKIILLLAVLISIGAQAQQSNVQNPSISVTGEGIVKVVPDQVIIKSRIEHQGQNAETVKRQNDQVVDKVIKFLKTKGLAEKDIKTEYINLNKEYNYNDKTYSYIANQGISIHLNNLNDYEDIMSGLLEAGLNRIDGIQFKSSKIETYKTEARKSAVLNARKKAEEFASALDIKVGNPIGIQEFEANDYQPIYRMNEMVKMSSDAGIEQSIAPGEMEVSAKVNVVFNLGN